VTASFDLLTTGFMLLVGSCEALTCSPNKHCVTRHFANWSKIPRNRTGAAHDARQDRRPRTQSILLRVFLIRPLRAYNQAASDS
jgi:hypothetical protein